MQGLRVLLVTLVFASVAFGFGTLCGSNGSSKKFVAPPPTVMPRNFKVAFLGDAGNDRTQEEVLQLVKNWGAQVVIHSGDFDYDDNPTNFENNINAVLGANFPYFASIGNHDVAAWTGYQRNLVARLNRIGANVNCTGDLGVNMACNWNGLFFVLSGVGTRGTNHVNFIHDTFESYPAVWKFVSWHKNQRLMQIGGKTDETGWPVYDATREHGAIIMTGHEHSYCRSYMMSNIERQVVANRNATLNLKVGESFVVVSGLGGESIRTWNEQLRTNPWWAAVAADDNGVSDGVLLCTFNINGELRKAQCDFEDTNGRSWDSFTIMSQLPSTQEEMQAQLAAVRAAKQAGQCRKEFIEIPLTSEEADAEELPTGEVLCHADRVLLRPGRLTSLRFDNIPLAKGAKVESAYLQVYSAASAAGRTHRYVITGSGEREFAPCKAGRSHALTSEERKVTRAAVAWTHEDEGWEKHTVWVTPNLKEIVEEVVSEPNWQKGNGLTLNLGGKGHASFYTFEHSPCVAPTLTLEVKNC